MAHKEQLEFCLKVKKKFPKLFENRKVLDVGSLDINGSNSKMFPNCLYLGIDVAPGPNVQLVCKAHELNIENSFIDTIISTECFEHDMYYEKSLKNIVRLLKSGGLFLFTCATTGRPEHGTRASQPEDAPLLIEHGEWADYYKNLEEKDIRDVLDIDSIFKEYEFSTNEESKDLYFYGIKR